MMHKDILKQREGLLSGLLLVTVFVLSGICASYARADYVKKDYVGDLIDYKVQDGDVFVDLARAHNLGFVELRSANPYVDPWYPEPGSEIVLPARHLLPAGLRRDIIINLAEMRLYLFDRDGNVKRHFPIGIGRDGLDTPLGTTTIVAKKEGPVWRPTKRMRDANPALPAAIAPGPDNPLGTHALYLGWPTFLIHGTNKPSGIGRRVSSGCIRMYPENIKELFTLARPGMTVRVINQPLKYGWIGEHFYVEAHTPYDKALDVEDGENGSYYALQDDMVNIVMKQVRTQNQKIKADADNDKTRDAGEYKIDWLALRDTITKRKGIPISVISR